MQTPEIDDIAEQFGCTLGVVQGRMRFFLFPVQTRSLNCPGQYGLAVCQAAQGGRVKRAEGVKRIAGEAAAVGCGIDETQVKGRIVPHQDGAAATLLLHHPLDGLEDIA